LKDCKIRKKTLAAFSTPQHSDIYISKTQSLLNAEATAAFSLEETFGGTRALLIYSVDTIM